MAPATLVKTASVVVQDDAAASVDFLAAGNVTFRKHNAIFSVPAGAYGDFSVEQGTLLLGVPGSLEPLRYEFRTLDVQPGGRIRALGPVVVTVAQGGTWQGPLGDALAPFLLDVRVAAGDVSLAPGCEFDGFLSAPNSLVTIAARAALVGGLIGDRLVVERTGSARAVMPDWSATAADGVRAAFAHRAIRLQRDLPKLKNRVQGGYTAAAAYVLDVPFVMVTAGRAGTEPAAAAGRENAAFFEALNSMLAESGFARGGVVLTGYGAGAPGGPPPVRNVPMRREQFVDLVQAIGGKTDLQQGIAALRASPVALDEFMRRALALAHP
jgi:hypothetical protein